MKNCVLKFIWLLGLTTVPTSGRSAHLSDLARGTAGRTGFTTVPPV